MDPVETREAHIARSMEFANAGILAGTDGDYSASLRLWTEALHYAEANVPDDNIILWIRSALGDALLSNGDYQGALDMAGSALAFCAAHRQPLAAITMAKAHLRVGEVGSARDYVRQACEMKGERVLDVFSAEDRKTLAELAQEGS